MKDKEKQIEEMPICVNCIHAYVCEEYNLNRDMLRKRCAYHNDHFVDIKDSVVLSREEFEKLKSLYDTQKGAIMTSSIGDLPLTVDGLRKAVDEITRLNRVEAELQELNAKYYNEAKDLRRKLKEASKETAEKIYKKVRKLLKKVDIIVDRDDWLIGYEESAVDKGLTEIAKQFGIEIKE